MPKDKNIKAYVQKYVASWELEPAFKGWLKPLPDGDSTKAFCAFCKTILSAHKKGLSEYATTKKHEQCIQQQQLVSALPKIDKFAKVTLSQKRKKAELKIAAYVAEHSSMKSVDHLSLVMKDLDVDSPVLQDIKLHWTKCAALIKHILSPCILEDLLADVGNSYYSLIIDESTTIDTKKNLCLMIRYFSQTKKKVITTFYRLIEMSSGTSDAITAAILQQLKNDRLETAKLLGLGVDGASVNVGAHHSVTTILRDVNPDIVVIKCICHSLHLAAEEACKALPRHLDFREEVYKTLEGTVPKKIVKLSNTRWLVRRQAVDAILKQCDELQLHFNITQSNKERCYTALQLHGMFSTPENKLYLTFHSTSLKGIMALNRLFQSNAVDPVKLFKDLNDTIYSILQTLVVPTQLQKVSQYDLATFDFRRFCMPVDCLNFGYEFNVLTANVHRESVSQIKERCKDFLFILVSQLQKRVPENIKILDQISTFSPQSASSGVKADITNIAAKFKQTLCSDIDSTVKEWNLLHRVEVADKTSTETYWAEINDLTDSGGNKRFGNVSKLVLGLLSLPFSNAAVERTFNIVSIVNDKLRNKMLVAMLETILHVRCTLDDECYKFKPKASMLKLFNSETVYTKISDEDVMVLNTLPTE